MNEEVVTLIKDAFRHFHNKSRPEKLYDHILELCKEKKIESFSRKTLYKYLKNPELSLKKIAHNGQNVEYELIEPSIETRLRQPLTWPGWPSKKELRIMDANKRRKLIHKALSALFRMVLTDEFAVNLFPSDKEIRRSIINHKKIFRKVIRQSISIDPDYTQACITTLAEYHKII